MTKKIPPKYQPWIDARKRFHLSDMHIQMARELGMNPKKLGKLNNEKQEPWKMPLKDFIEHLYFKRFGKEKPDVVLSIEKIIKEQRKKKQAKIEKKYHQIDIQIDHLIKSIRNIPGQKILTLVLPNLQPFVIDVNEAGEFGYEKGHEQLFRTKIFLALNHGGGLTIRQFLPFKVERETPDGQKHWIPKKNIYMVYLGSKKWIPLGKSEVELAHCTDYETGKPLPKEDDVYYCDFPIEAIENESDTEEI